MDRTPKKRATEESATLREIVDRAKRFKLRWKTLKRARLRPGVVLEDRNSLFDLMDGRGR